jgi:hypothetical protein
MSGGGPGVHTTWWRGQGVARVSWYFEDSSHGDGLTEGLDRVQ